MCNQIFHRPLRKFQRRFVCSVLQHVLPLLSLPVSFDVFCVYFGLVCVFRAGFRAKHDLPPSAAERGVSIGERRRKISPGRGCCEFLLRSW
jgi:hypothetical protein